jgi:hypothetical protein
MTRPIVTFVMLVASTGGRDVSSQTPPAQPPSVSVSAIGCLAQTTDAVTAPPTGHEQAAAKGLTLTRATVRMQDAPASVQRSAVPGSLPSGVGTGTTDSAAPREAKTVEQAYWIVGPKASELLRFLGRRVEVTGTIDDRLAANPGNRAVTDAGAAAARRSTAAAAEPPAPAHPSAPTRALSVATFRVLDDSCVK